LVPVTSAVVPVVAAGVAAEVVLDEDAAGLVLAEPEATSDATADDVAELVAGDVELVTVEVVKDDMVVTGVSDAGSSIDVMSDVGLDEVTVSLVDVVGTAAVTVSEDEDGGTSMIIVLVEVGASGTVVVVVASGVVVLVRLSREMDADGDRVFVTFVVSVAAPSEVVAEVELTESVRITDVAMGSREEIITDPFKDMAQLATA
ncbi:hypothetical protein HK405_001573, partial [Cladochytrium tenue]